MTCLRRLSAVLRRDGILFFFFRERDGVVVAAVTEAAGVVRVVAVLARAVTVVKGRFRPGVKERFGAGVAVFAFSRTRLLRFA